MTSAEFAAMRLDHYRREDFLAWLSRMNSRNIARIARAMAGIWATWDIISGEATQAFLMAANRAIDSAKIEDDGRGKNDPVAWCAWKGLNGVRDYIRSEFGTATRMSARHEIVRNTINETELYAKLEPEYRTRQVAALFRDPSDYEEQIVSHLMVREFLETLVPVDRSIVELIVYGHDELHQIRCAGSYGDAKRCTAADIARTIGRCESFVYKRIATIRTTMKGT